MKKRIICFVTTLILMIGVIFIPQNNVQASSSVTTDNIGNFYWIWQLQDQVNQYGSIQALISHLKSLGVNNVCIKYHEGSSYSGGGVNFKSDYLKYYSYFKQAGFTVGTWGYNYFNNQGAEANVIVEALQNSSYYIYDPEIDVSGKWTACANVCATVRRSTTKPIGYSSFPIASYHQDIPYSVFNQYCDFTSPQIYWGELQWDSTKAINRTISDYQSLGLNLPIYPSVQTYGVTVGSYSVCKNYGFKYYGYWDLDEQDNNFVNSLGYFGSVATTNNTSNTVSTDKLQQQIASLQYDFNLVHGDEIYLTEDGIAGTKTLNALNSYLIELNTNNVENQWIQEKLISWNYLPKGNDSGYWDKSSFQAITELQKNWNLSTDGIIGKNTWNIFLTN
jgi:hypothetical protein